MLQQLRSTRPRLGVSAALAFFLVAIAGCNGGSSSSSGSASTASSSSSITISGTPATQVQAGQAYSFTPSVTPAADVSFSIQNKPAWASFSISTGQLSGTPTSANDGSYSNVVITASNGSSSASLPSFDINVGSQSPTGTGSVTLAWVAPTDNTNGTPVTNLAGYVIEYGTNSASLNQTVTVASPSTTSYTVQNLGAGTWYFGVAAYTTDGAQSSFTTPVSETIQ